MNPDLLQLMHGRNDVPTCDMDDATMSKKVPKRHLGEAVAMSAVSSRGSSVEAHSFTGLLRCIVLTLTLFRDSDYDRYWCRYACSK